MGGASSFYAMLAITGFLTSLWLAGKFSKIIHVSSIVLEVAVGVVLGPQVAKLIPTDLSESYTKLTWDCESDKWQKKIAEKGYKYCDLEAYLKSDKYLGDGVAITNENWDAGFWGKGTTADEDGTVVISGKKGGTFCLKNKAKAPCSRRLDDGVHETDLLNAYYAVDETESENRSSWFAFRTPRRLAKDKKGKTIDDGDYNKCIKDACELDVALESATVPDIFTLVGHTGVAMMIFESGLHFDFEQAKTVGPWATAVAILGTFLPLVSGALLAFYAFEFELIDSLSCGVALAPTSVGIALKLLHEAKALQEYFGQAVMTAAFVDDVLSLILFSVLFSLGDDPTFVDFLPLIGGIVFMVVAILAAVAVWPRVIKWLFSMIPEKKPHAKVTTHDEVMWFLMFLVLTAYCCITHECGTHLWGAFIGGMSFAGNHHSAHVWVKQVKRLTCWFLRIFFGCTLAWSIPVKSLLQVESFLKGSAMGIGPCILTKVLCGPFMGPSRWVIGWAMVGRAEFAYFIAILAKSVNMMHEDLFAILVWALLYATIFAPLIFRKVLHRYMRSLGKDFVDKDLASSVSGHLPDLEAEEEAEEELHILEKIDTLEATVQNKDIEISELKKQHRAEVAALMKNLELANEAKTTL
mmetsp:Transcript_12815/g.22993  ORF Transcript_12815/g.22993 Transcript_12815/m.22993 type:complete len:637 (-) Transcript_12815:256-2166(-)